MRIVGYTTPKKYSVLVCDCIGNPQTDVQRCANTIKEAREVAEKYMKDVPLACAVIYRINRHYEAVPVGDINPAGKYSVRKEEK